ncbi:MAG: aminopeptidase [Candidatus Cloacimonetes bacterium]|nr:aminopeptidase [Candidatus Cloacimonadota bacterium]
MQIDKFFETRKKETEKEYLEVIARLETIRAQLEPENDKLKQFIYKCADKALAARKLELDFSDKYYLKNSLKTLQERNTIIWSELLPDRYKYSILNPEYAVMEFGNGMGQMLSFYYTIFFNFKSYIFSGKGFMNLKWMKNLIDMYNLLMKGTPDYETIKALIVKSLEDIDDDLNIASFIANWTPEYGKNHKIIADADLSDNRYLYQYGNFVSENELKIADFMRSYPEEKLQRLAARTADGFIRSYTLSRKDLAKKKTYNLIYNLGQERLARAVAVHLAKHDLKPFYSRVSATPINRQYDYDQRFANAFFYNEEYVNKSIELFEKQCKAAEDLLRVYGGPVYFDNFGEKPFDPEQKKECLKYTPEQQQISQMSRTKSNQIMHKYIPRDETSFCIIGFPTPEIGDKFEEIYEATAEVNMLDTEKWEAIQQKIVDRLDLAEKVHVKGTAGNETDIMVMMQKLDDPSKQTNFVNCGADVNIPVGEVFTSPKLTGTDGVLHIKETFLNGLKFQNLKLTFKDGFVSDYSCTNNPDEEKNRKYIEENLLFPHKTLPIGEFAIGTNTLAHVMAKKFDILDVLPVLIIEKMGPHFAIGDTCFSWEEDFPSYNPIDGKEITARENEMSCKRKTDPQNAYTGVHTDITLPYEELGFITAITPTGEKLDIIRNGRFAVPGTEEFNKPLDEME